MKKINEMNLKEKLGQLIFPGFDGYEYNDHIKKLVEDYKVGNVILFTRNVQDANQLFKLTKRIHEEVIKHTGNIPLIAIDQEGGMVTRIMNGVTFLPGAMTTGATNLDNAYRIGEIMGEELISLGINMNLAPSLDVNNNAANPVINVRSYSDNPEKVALYGKKVINGMQKNVIATAKHFPGHGDTEIDSHYGLPVVNLSKERLANIELFPFKQVIDEVDAIMSAHIVFPAYEQNKIPATLSKAIMTDLLRKELGFKGLLVSDCMEMKAIADTYGTANGTVMGIEAGLDMVFISHSLSEQIDALEKLEKKIISGEMPIEVIDEKVARILKYKEKTRVRLEEKFYSKKEFILEKENIVFAQKVVEDSLTLVKGKNVNLNKKTLIVAVDAFAKTIVEDVFNNRSIIDAVKLHLPHIDTIKITAKLDDEKINEIMKASYNYEQVLVFTFNAASYKKQVKLVKLLNQVTDLFVIAMRGAYDLLAFEEINNFACLYEYTPNSVNAVIKYLKHEMVPIGNLPVKIEKDIKIGASIYVGLDQYKLKDNLKYLELLKKYNIDLLFISAHMPEMKDFAEDLNTVINRAKELGLKVILDVSRKSMDEITVPDDIYSLRLDYGFSNDDILEYAKTKKYFIELNASTINTKKLDYLINNGIDLSKLRISHNFYPKPYTGLSFESVCKKNQEYKKYGFDILVYIASANERRGPIHQGLPTLERHRYNYLEVKLQEAKILGAREICFGDAFCSEEELLIASKFNYSVITLPVIVKKSLPENQRRYLEQIHINRSDEADVVKRSSGRLKEEITPFNNKTLRRKGDITVDNSLFARYAGELNILKADIENDERVNVIARIIQSEYLMDAILPGSKFKFLVVGEEE